MTQLRGALSNLKQKGLLLYGLSTGDIARAGPIFIDIDLTGRCNLRCLCCPYHSPSLETGAATGSSDIPYRTVESLYRELGPMKTASVILQGSGEPLLHPRVLDLVALSKQSGFHTTLLTNGTLLNADMMCSMIASRLDVIKISLWATSPEEYARNYPGVPPQHFERVLEAFRLTARLKQESKSAWPLVFWHYPINHHNCRSLESLVELAHTVDCNGVTFSPLYDLPNLDASARMNPEETRLVISSLVEIRERMDRLGLRHNIDQALLRYRIGAAVWEKFACYIAWYHIRVRVDGKVASCGRCNKSFGNLNESTFQEIWNGTAIREFRRHSRTRAGLVSLQSDCDCRYCCFVSENARVDRLYRFLAPLNAGSQH